MNEQFPSHPKDGIKTIDLAPLHKALAAWRDAFGGKQTTLGIDDPIPFAQGAILCSGGVGVVHESSLGTAVA